MHKAKARSIAAPAVCPVRKWEKRGGGGASVCMGRQSCTVTAGAEGGQDPKAACLHHLTSPGARTQIARVGL